MRGFLSTFVPVNFKIENEMRQLKGVLLAIISSSTFGLIPLFALPAIREGVGLDSVLFYRFAISAVAVGIFL